MLLNGFLGGLGNSANKNVIKFDEANVNDIRSRLAKVQSKIDTSTTYIKNITTESDTVWTGEAAKLFFSQCTALRTKTEKLSSQLEKNIRELDTAMSILTQGNAQTLTDIKKLNSRKVFRNS